MIINFNDGDAVRRNLGKSLTLTGTFIEIVYKDHNGNVIPFSDPAQIVGLTKYIEAIFLNTGTNVEYSILIEGDAVVPFINQHGAMLNDDIKKYVFTCNNVLLESSQGTDKLFSRIQSEEQLEDFKGIER